MWKDKLKKVQEIGRAYSLACVNPGAPKEVISGWAARNGFILYGVDRELFDSLPYAVYGLIEQNEIWREPEGQRAYLFLGESNISWYVYEAASGRYMELDNPSGRETAVFRSGGEMLEKLLDDCLS